MIKCGGCLMEIEDSAQLLLSTPMNKAPWERITPAGTLAVLRASMTEEALEYSGVWYHEICLRGRNGQAA